MSWTQFVPKGKKPQTISRTATISAVAKHTIRVSFSNQILEDEKIERIESRCNKAITCLFNEETKEIAFKFVEPDVTTTPLLGKNNGMANITEFANMYNLNAYIESVESHTQEIEYNKDGGFWIFPAFPVEAPKEPEAK